MKSITSLLAPYIQLVLSRTWYRCWEKLGADRVAVPHHCGLRFCLNRWRPGACERTE